MILLGTNVISELARPRPDEAVLDWVGTLNGLPVYISMITQAEILAGLAMMPLGKRRAELEATTKYTLEHDFAGRIHVFDSDATYHYAEILAHRRNIGRPIQENDCQIAAIAKSRGFKLATRNTGDFQDCGIALINPWQRTNQ